MDTSGAPGCDRHDRKWSMKLQTMSGHVSESSRTGGRGDLPGRMKVEPGDPGCEADVSSAPWSIKRVLKRLQKLSNTSERKHKCSKQRSRKDSPGRPGGEPDEQGAETAVPGDIHDLHKRPRKVRNEHVDETDTPG